MTECYDYKSECDKLAKHILELQADKGRLTDENRELQETIDKLREQLAFRYDLEDKLANADYQLEGRDLEIKELKAQLEREKNLNQCMSDHNEQLRELIEKMKLCGSCGNRTIGNCGHCKRKPNQKSTDTDDYWRLKEIKEK